MRVKTRVAQFGDLLGEEFDTVGRITKDDRLVDLKLYYKLWAEAVNGGNDGLLWKRGCLDNVLFVFLLRRRSIASHLLG